MSDYIIDVEHLRKSFNGKPAVKDVSLQVKKGEIFGFLGPNGSGKTTTIRIICGLMTLDSGTGQCLGFDIVTQSQAIKRLVGYVPQMFSLYQDLTVRENLEFVARIYGLTDYIQRTQKMMAELELTPYQHILAGRLSGGWKQRVSLAAALIHDPKLLLLDEPTAGVDPKARREFWDYITQLTARGITALVSTHYMDEAERCNRLAYIVYGEMMAEGTIPEIIQQSGLYAWRASANGQPLVSLADQVRGQPGVLQVVIWGNELRICGTDQSLLKEVVDQHPDYLWHQAETSLEEVFIHLVGDHSEEAAG